ncbi:flagellar hook-length control protein FliK [Sphingomonas sp. PvP056]|uniref:flagellar hook-length control protein FliK n=1 Tax=Sphingomonas sp. PvP056 TaxID=3156392 RepID=UPI003394065F
MPPVAAVSILPSALTVQSPVPTDDGASAPGFQQAVTASADASPDLAVPPTNAVPRDSGLTLAATLATAALPANAGITAAPTVSAPVDTPVPNAKVPDPAPAPDAEPTAPPLAPAPRPSASPKPPVANARTANRPVDAAMPETAVCPDSGTDAPPTAPDAPTTTRKPAARDEAAAKAGDPAACDTDDHVSAAPPLDMIGTTTLPVAVPAAQQIAGQEPATAGTQIHGSAPALVGNTASAPMPDRVETAAPPEAATDTGTTAPAFAPPPHRSQDAPAQSSAPTEHQTTATAAPPGSTTVPAAQPPAVQPSAPVPLPASPLPPRRPVDAGIARAVSIGRDVGVAITRHATRDGASTLTIRLDPVELGRVEVRMQIDPAGKMLATISAEHASALDLLRRDATMLAQTLSQAGLQADAASFRFDTQAGPGNGANTARTGNTGGGNAGSNAGGGTGERGWAFAAPSRRPGDDATDPRNAPAPTRAALLASGRINLVA